MTGTSEICTMKRVRDRHFLQACRRVVSETNRPLTVAEVALAAAASPAPEFYVSFNYALRKLRILRERGMDNIPEFGPTAAFRDLDRRVAKRMSRTGETDTEALSAVLAEGKAPCFYLRPGGAIYLYHVLRKRSRLHRRVHRHVPLR